MPWEDGDGEWSLPENGSGGAEGGLTAEDMFALTQAVLDARLAKAAAAISRRSAAKLSVEAVAVLLSLGIEMAYETWAASSGVPDGEPSDERSDDVERRIKDAVNTAVDILSAMKPAKAKTDKVEETQ